MSSDDLPDYAKAPWPEPDPPKGEPPRLAPRPDPLTTQISETHEGVQALQVLLEQPEEPSKMDVVVDLLETIAGQQRTLTEGLTLLFQRQAELFRAMSLRIPPPRD